MILWVLLTLMVAISVAGVTIPLVRRHQARGEATMAVFRDQLAEIDAQVAAGAVPPEEAEALRNEIRKRLLAEDRYAATPAQPLAQATYARLALGLAAIVALAATGLYALMGRPDLAERPVAAAQDAGQGPEQKAGDVDSMIGQLKAKVDANPGDAEGWRMLGWSYMQTGRPGDAVAAYREALTISPNEPAYQSALGEALVATAGGTVSPEARDLFAKANATDPADPRSRYFLALAKGQAGDRKGALEDLVALLNSAPADAPWAAELRPIVEQQAKDLGVDVSGKLKTGPAPAPAAPMPTAEQVQQAQQMAPADRQAMIRGMVDGLAARLKDNPKDLEGWQRLMRARMVLGDKAAASQAYRDAQRVFPGDTAQSRALRQAAQDLGIST